MDRIPHFRQAAGHPVLTGTGSGELACRCGSVLVAGYSPTNFLAVDFECASCGTVTTSPGLQALGQPPSAVVQLERTAQTPPEGARIGANQVFAGAEEMDRLATLYKPAGPTSDHDDIDNDWLDALVADFERLGGGSMAHELATIARMEADRPLSGLKAHQLAWAVHTLRSGLESPDFVCTATDPANVATTLAAGFRHFVACWSHHPLFPEMMATLRDHRFSLHGLALFGSAKCLSDGNNRVAFLPARDGAKRITSFHIALGPSDKLGCFFEPFDKYEWPDGAPGSRDIFRPAIGQRIAASKGRIHRKSPGMLILSPGIVASSLDQHFVDAIHANHAEHGRQFRSLAAVCIVMGMTKAWPERNRVTFGYHFLPIANPHYKNETSVEVTADRPPGF